MSDKLTEQAAADFLGMKRATLRQWRARGEGPDYIRMGRAIRYDQRVLETFVNDNRKKPGSVLVARARGVA